MNTPICDFVARYASSEPIRLHMPGHKGVGPLGAEALDITEIPGADVLYHASGIIQESQRNAAALFGTKKTLYSAEGSSLPIRAMLYLTALYARRMGKRPCIAAGRNAHKVFITAAALLDADVRWIYPREQESILRCALTADDLDACLRAYPEIPTAVYITSPDYLGNMADIPALAAVCRKYGCLLLVDNAHGAYLHFLTPSRHPMALGADLCCDSAHKTLPVLTGGAYLHISNGAPDFLAEAAEQAMALFASTSPSYLILQSLDRANACLAAGYAEKLSRAAEVWDKVKSALQNSGFALMGEEPLKLTILPKSRGYTGEEMAGILEEQHIFCEFSDPDHLVFMLPAEFDPALPERLQSALLSIPPRPALQTRPPRLSRAEQALTPREALFRPSCQISSADSVGRIMASPCVSCPPAIPIVSMGERIDARAVEAFAWYGIETLRVVEEDQSPIHQEVPK